MIGFGALGELPFGGVPTALAALTQSNGAGIGPLGQFALGEQGASNTSGDGLGIASESDSAIAITALRNYTLGLASEADSALTVTYARSFTLGVATETDSALSADAFRTGKRRLVAAIAN